MPSSRHDLDFDTTAYRRVGLCSDASCIIDEQVPVFLPRLISCASSSSECLPLDLALETGCHRQVSPDRSPTWDLQLHHLHLDPGEQGLNHRLLRAKLPGCLTVQEIVERIPTGDSTGTGIDVVVTDNALMIVFSLKSIVAVPLYMTLIAAKRLNDEMALVAIIRDSGTDANKDK
ncbi:unnamed protein product [Polarella glacialis]|uniref:Uncharacterized protein n=1 Tax=Polarella glacialis TaxID=89957 RepID=A0A813LYK8_POLGL|nr:unnamed protein product [Polarella glacialis]